MQASLVTSACVLALSGCGSGGFLAGENLVDGVEDTRRTQQCYAEGQHCSEDSPCPKGLTCYVKDEFWAACRHDCDAGEEYECDEPKFKTPWSCDLLAEGQNCKDSLCPD